MRKISLLIGLFCLIMVGLQAQSPLKSLEIGLPYRVECSCADSLGNIYAITRTDLTDESDSMALYFFNVQLQKWSFISSHGNVYSSLGERQWFIPHKSDCNLLNGKLYFTSNFYDVNASITEFRTVLYTITLGGTWSLFTEFSGGNYGSVTAYKFSNKLYFIGNFDTISSLNMPKQVAVYDGTNFSTTNLPISYSFNSISTVTGVGPSIETSTDTLLIASGKYVYYHVYPNVWGIFYTSNRQLNPVTIAGSCSSLYITYDRSLDVVRNGFKIDSFNYVQPGSSFSYSGNKLIKFKNKIYLKDYGVIYQITGIRDLKPVLSFSSLDTTHKYEFLNYNNTNLYYYAKNGVFYNGLDFHNIAEIISDSLRESSFDTVIVMAFRDHNKNNVMDGQEKASAYCNFLCNNISFYTDVNGQYSLYPLDNEDVKVSFVSESIQDSCFKTFFSGAISSSCYLSPKSQETIRFPLRRTSLKNRNLILRSYGYFNERIGDTTPLVVKVFNRDCDNSTANVVVKITLDSNTSLVASSPTFTSRLGNVLTYNLNI
ncbi:MAG: hypothetical protein PSX81_07915 [bacterium]|nr:hypothetical protein [bacterium]